MESPRYNMAGIIGINQIVSFEPSLKETNLELRQKLKQSIKSHGQTQLVLCCEIILPQESQLDASIPVSPSLKPDPTRYHCIIGQEVVEAMKELGLTMVIVTNTGIISDEQKDLLILENFKDYHQVNYMKVATKLKRLLETTLVNELCSTIPFDARQVENLVKMTEFDWNAFNDSKKIQGQHSLFDFEAPATENEELPGQVSIFDVIEEEEQKNSATINENHE